MSGSITGAVKRVQYDRYGDPTRLRLSEFTPRPPRRGEVHVQVAAAAANPLDWKIRRGQMRWAAIGRPFPRGVGHDLSGTVVRTGPGVQEFTVGDAVFGAVGMAAGALAEVVVVKATNLTHKPDGLSFEQAAALPMVGLTALQALNRARIDSGRRVFVNAETRQTDHLAPTDPPIISAAAIDTERTGQCRDDIGQSGRQRQRAEPTFVDPAHSDVPRHHAVGLTGFEPATPTPPV